MMSGWSIDWFLESSRAWSFFHPSVCLINQKPHAFVSFNKPIKLVYFCLFVVSVLFACFDSRSYENRSKCVTPCNKFVFILNWLQNLSARRPEMTCPLPAKISHIEAGMVHAKTSGSFVRHFVFFWHKRDSFLDWTFPLTGSPIIKCIYHN